MRVLVQHRSTLQYLHACEGWTPHELDALDFQLGLTRQNEFLLDAVSGAGQVLVDVEGLLPRLVGDVDDGPALAGEVLGDLHVGR